MVTFLPVNAYHDNLCMLVKSDLKVRPFTHKELVEEFGKRVIPVLSELSQLNEIKMDGNTVSLNK